MAEDVAQIEADGSDSDTCHPGRGKGIGPAKWGHSRSQTCSTLVSVFKSSCAATLFFSTHPCNQAPSPQNVQNMVHEGEMEAEKGVPVSLPASSPLCMQNEVAGLTEVHCAFGSFSADCSAKRLVLLLIPCN